MEMLNSISMMLGKDLWTIIIDWFSTWIVNYGWLIILFTIVLKLVMSPLDIFQRISSQKQSRVMNVLQPEMAELQKKYGNDRQKLSVEQQKLYKKHNVSMGGMCLSMFLTLAISLVVFFTLFASLRGYGNTKLYESYNQLETVCVEKLNGKQISELNEEELTNIKIEINNAYNKVEEKNSWLWVKNVWKSDSNTSQFVEFEDWAKHNNLSAEAKSAAKARYDFITQTIDGEQPDWNGYYILLIAAAGVSFLTQFISTKLITPKGQKLNTMNKIMFIVMPISMVIFASTSNAVFTLYIITNSVMTTIISAVISLVMKNKDKGKTDAELISGKKIEVVEYSRNYKK